MPNIEQENNQSEERLKLLKTKTKTHLEKAQEKLRRTRPDESSDINKPQAVQEQPSPAAMPARTEPSQPTPSPTRASVNELRSSPPSLPSEARSAKGEEKDLSSSTAIQDFFNFFYNFF